MTDKPKVNFSVYMKHHFGKPLSMNWSFPIFVLSILTLVFFIFRCIYKKYDAALPVTSLVGYALLMSLFLLITLILPFMRLGNGIYKKAIGNFSGIGSLIVACLSGLPLMLITTSLHNLGSYLWLRMNMKTVFPALFYFSSDGSIMGDSVAFISETVLPAFAVSLFFFGFLWSRFRSRERFVGAIIVSVVYVCWSMNPMMFVPLFIVSMWCFFLRTTVENIWGPFICLISMRLIDYVFLGTLSKVDLLTVQTHSDIAPTYLYASLPSLIFGLIILIFFRSTLLEFSNKHRIIEDEELSDAEIPAFSKGINLSIVVSAIIFLVITILLLKGVHL